MMIIIMPWRKAFPTPSCTLLRSSPSTAPAISSISTSTQPDMPRPPCGKIAWSLTPFSECRNKAYSTNANRYSKEWCLSHSFPQDSFLLLDSGQHPLLNARHPLCWLHDGCYGGFYLLFLGLLFHNIQHPTVQLLYRHRILWTWI